MQGHARWKGDLMQPFAPYFTNICAQFGGCGLTLGPQSPHSGVALREGAPLDGFIPTSLLSLDHLPPT